MIRAWTKATVFILFYAGFTTSVWAAPFQFEVSGTFGQSQLSVDGGGNFDADVMGVEVSYYLLPVDYDAGPLRERPFLDKSAFITGSFAQTDPDAGDSTDVMSLEAHFVTATNFIFEAEYSTIDDDFSDETIVGFGAGKYLDDVTTAVLSYTTSDNDGFDINIISGNYRKLSKNATSGATTAIELELGYIDTDDESGLSIGLAGFYYPSNELGLIAALERTDIDDFDSTTLLFGFEFFLAENLFGGLTYSRADFSNDIEVDTFLLNAGARF